MSVEEHMKYTDKDYMRYLDFIVVKYANSINPVTNII